VICGTSVRVPVLIIEGCRRMDYVCLRSGRRRRVMLLVKTIPTIYCCIAYFRADLTLSSVGV